MDSYAQKQFQWDNALFAIVEFDTAHHVKCNPPTGCFIHDTKPSCAGVDQTKDHSFQSGLLFVTWQHFRSHRFYRKLVVKWCRAEKLFLFWEICLRNHFVSFAAGVSVSCLNAKYIPKPHHEAYIWNWVFPVPLPLMAGLAGHRNWRWSEIVAINAELVGLPLFGFVLYPKYFSNTSIFPRDQPTSMAWRMARSTREGVVWK